MALGDVAGGEHDRGAGPAPDRCHGLLLVGDQLIGLDQVDPGDAGKLGKLGAAPEDPYSDPVGRRSADALDHGLGATLGPERVEGDHRVGGLDRPHWEGRWLVHYSAPGSPVGEGASRSITSRPA